MAERARRASKIQSALLVGVTIVVFCPMAWKLLKVDILVFLSDDWDPSQGRLPMFLLSIFFASLIAGTIAYLVGFWTSLRLQRWVDGTRKESSEQWRERVAREISERPRSNGPSSSPARPRP